MAISWEGFIIIGIEFNTHECVSSLKKEARFNCQDLAKRGWLVSRAESREAEVQVTEVKRYQRAGVW